MAVRQGTMPGAGRTEADFAWPASRRASFQ
jgi:hypothetical protein